MISRSTASPGSLMGMSSSRSRRGSGIRFTWANPVGLPVATKNMSMGLSQAYSSRMILFSWSIGWKSTWTLVGMAGSSSTATTPRFPLRTPVPMNTLGSVGLPPWTMAWMSFTPRILASLVYSFPWIRL